MSVLIRPMQTSQSSPRGLKEADLRRDTFEAEPARVPATNIKTSATTNKRELILNRMLGRMLNSGHNNGPRVTETKAGGDSTISPYVSILPIILHFAGRCRSSGADNGRVRSVGSLVSHSELHSGVR